MQIFYDIIPKDPGMIAVENRNSYIVRCGDLKEAKRAIEELFVPRNAGYVLKQVICDDDFSDEKVEIIEEK